MAINNLITSYFSNLEKSINVISENAEMYRYGDDFEFEDEKVSELNVKSVFGIVPAFDAEGAVSFYIRYGGPEHLKYHPDATFSVGTVFEGLSSIYGRTATSKFAEQYARIFDGDEDLSYTPSNARERHFIQTTYSKLGDNAAEEFLSTFYPFKLKYNPKQSHFTLQYVPFGTNTYKNINAENIAEDVILSFVLELSEFDKDSNSPINLFTNIDNIKTATSAFFEKMKTDFVAQVKARLYTADNDAGNNNDNDVPYVAAFVQHLKKNRYDDLKAITARVTEVSNKITSWLTDVKKTKIADNVSTFFSSRVPTDAQILAEHDTLKSSLDAKSKEFIAAKNRADVLEGEKATLTSKLSKVKDELGSAEMGSSRVRYFGAAAGAGAAFLALQQDEVKDLETWQKGAIVATGALLGMVPYLNLLTIGASSYLVREGLAVTREHGPRAVTAFKSIANRGSEGPSEA